VHTAAADALQHALGDLELVFAYDKKRQLLADLPQAALLQLLRDERTRVASENTAVLEWADDNNATTQQMHQLVRAWLTGKCCQGITMLVIPISLRCCATKHCSSCCVASCGYATAINS
jgi:hypothetical protein